MLKLIAFDIFIFWIMIASYVGATAKYPRKTQILKMGSIIAVALFVEIFYKFIF